MDVEKFKRKVLMVKNYSDLRKLVLDNNMPNVAARCLGIENSKKNFGCFLHALKDADFSVRYLVEHYQEIFNANEDQMIRYMEKKKRKAEKRRKEREEREHRYFNDCYDIHDYYDNDDDDDYYDDGYYDAMEKNYNLVNDYESFKDSMCGGIGQRRIKLMLNKLIQNGDIVAAMYRALLETENTNINAKKYNNTRSVNYKDKLYAEKETLIKSVIDLFRMYNDEHPGDDRAVYGKEIANNYSANWIVYFDAPGMKQVSFHTNIENSYMRGLPDYPDKWDGMVNSTLGKIEKAINERYPEEITKLKAKIAKENEAKARKKEKERAERLAKQINNEIEIHNED